MYILHAQMRNNRRVKTVALHAIDFEKNNSGVLMINSSRA